MCVQDGTADLSYFSRLSFICKKKRNLTKILMFVFCTQKLWDLLFIVLNKWFQIRKTLKGFFKNIYLDVFTLKLQI